MDFVSLIGGLGIGGIAGLLLKEYFDNKKMISNRLFEEKREAYINYLNIASLSQTMTSEKALLVRTGAIERVRLCGSKKVLELLEIVSYLPPNHDRKPINDLIEAMRKDLFPNNDR